MGTKMCWRIEKRKLKGINNFEYRLRLGRHVQSSTDKADNFKGPSLLLYYFYYLFSING